MERNKYIFIGPGPDGDATTIDPTPDTTSADQQQQQTKQNKYIIKANRRTGNE